MDKMCYGGFTQALGIASSIASIVGLLITLRIFWDLRNIKNRYLFRARAPEMLERLEQHASNVAQHLTDDDASRHQIAVELADVRALLKSLKKKLPRRTRGSVDRLLERLAALDIYSAGERGVREVYVEIRGIIAEVRHLLEDEYWER